MLRHLRLKMSVTTSMITSNDKTLKRQDAEDVKPFKQSLPCAGPNLRVVGTMSVGYDHIDLKACDELGIKVGFTPNVLTNAVAELTVALLLATSRRLKEGTLERGERNQKRFTLSLCLL